MKKNEANKLYIECKNVAINLTKTSVTRTIESVKIILEDNHDITFLFYKGEIVKIEEFNGRELIEKYVER